MCTTPKDSSFDYPVDDTAEDLEEEIRKLLVIDRLEVSTRRPAQHTHTHAHAYGLCS